MYWGRHEKKKIIQGINWHVSFDHIALGNNPLCLYGSKH